MENRPGEEQTLPVGVKKIFLSQLKASRDMIWPHTGSGDGVQSAEAINSTFYHL